jgi:hypothetical protein
VLSPQEVASMLETSHYNCISKTPVFSEKMLSCYASSEGDYDPPDRASNAEYEVRREKRNQPSIIVAQSCILSAVSQDFARDVQVNMFYVRCRTTLRTSGSVTQYPTANVVIIHDEISRLLKCEETVSRVAHTSDVSEYANKIPVTL